MKSLTEIKKMLEEIGQVDPGYPILCKIEIINWLVSEVELAKEENKQLKFALLSTQALCDVHSSENSQLRLDLLTAQAQADGEYHQPIKAKQLIEESVSKWIIEVIEPLEDEFGFELRAKRIQSLYDFCEEALKKAQEEAVENYKNGEMQKLKSDNAALQLHKDQYEKRYLQGLDTIKKQAENIGIMREALEFYTLCSDGCTCGDGWGHSAAEEALKQVSKEERCGWGNESLHNRRN